MKNVFLFNVCFAMLLIGCQPTLDIEKEKTQLQRRASDRKELLQRMMENQQDTENAEDEIMRIRNERAKVENELKRLRKLLEEEKKKKKKNE